MSKRVIGFLTVVDAIPDAAEFLYNKPLVLDMTEEQKTERIINGEVRLETIEQVYYEVDEEDFAEISDRMELTAEQRIRKFLKEKILQ